MEAVMRHLLPEVSPWRNWVLSPRNRAQFTLALAQSPARAPAQRTTGKAAREPVGEQAQQASENPSNGKERSLET